MRAIKKFKLPQSIVDYVGEAWAGDYVVHELDARQYVQVQSAATSMMISEYNCINSGKPEAEQTKWDGVIPVDVLNKFIVCKSTTHNNVELDAAAELPSKLYMALAGVSLPANMLSDVEFKELFLS